MDNQTPETYEERVRIALASSRFGSKETELIENLADENGHVQGCFIVKPAPVEE